MNEEQKRVLKMVEAGRISPEQALALLEALDASDQAGETPEVTLASSETAPDLPDARSWWLYPTAAGAVVMGVGAPLMALGLTDRAAWFWTMCCGWVPFLIGLALLTLGVWSRNARWLHLRVKSAGSDRKNFALSIPLPLTLTAWLLKFVRPRVPQFQGTAIDEAILSLRDGLHEGDDQPIFIDVQDEHDGEQVTIFIG